jgi:hypothetical protein
MAGPKRAFKTRAFPRNVPLYKYVLLVMYISGSKEKDQPETQCLAKEILINSRNPPPQKKRSVQHFPNSTYSRGCCQLG